VGSTALQACEIDHEHTYHLTVEIIFIDDYCIQYLQFSQFIFVLGTRGSCNIRHQKDQEAMQEMLP